jgi:hypothetical protein
MSNSSARFESNFKTSSAIRASSLMQIVPQRIIQEKRSACGFPRSEKGAPAETQNLGGCSIRFAPEFELGAQVLEAPAIDVVFRNDVAFFIKYVNHQIAVIAL